MINASIRLLIVPVGIEMFLTLIEQFNKLLLIVPVGIEIASTEIKTKLLTTFNRTSRN